VKSTPYWQENTPRPADIPLSDLAKDIDVAIVGSGYTGLNAAITLTKSGVSVAVLEKHTIGWGSASRNGGFVTGLFAEPEDLERKYGLETARFVWSWSLDSLKYVDEIVTTEQIDCDFERGGGLYLAYKPSHTKILQEMRDLLSLKFEDHRHKFIEPEAVGEEIGSLAFHGALLDESGTTLDPAKFVYGLARTATKYGASLIENAEVNKIHRENGHFRLSTPRGDINAREVLIATNGYSTFLVPKIRFGVILGGGYCTVTERLPENLLKELSPKGRGFYDSRFFLNYFRLIPGGRLLFGGWKTLVRDKDPIAIGRKIQTRILEVFPQLAGVKISHAWTGRFAFTFDMLPHIGQVDGIHYALGGNGHGVGAMSYLGHEAAKLMSGEIDRSFFAEIKHQRLVFSPLDQLYWPFVNAWFRLNDLLS
jgi:glycine/D-amino acid oxidase-like deaminating enzyme